MKANPKRTYAIILAVCFALFSDSVGFASPQALDLGGIAKETERFISVASLDRRSTCSLRGRFTVFP